MNNFVLALHGFLGSGEDFLDLKNQCEKIQVALYDKNFQNAFEGMQKSHSNKLDFIKRSIHWETPSFLKEDQYENINIEKMIASIKSNEQYKASPRKVFLGYSLGGRLGIHLLKSDPGLFDHYIFCSTHSGLENESDKLQRIENDQQWIEKLKTLSWSSFMAAWNAQGVFTHTEKKLRLEDDFNKELLAQCLSMYSLGRQENFSEVLSRHKDKITWVVGEKDSKFLNLANNLEQKKILSSVERISGGHRLVFDNYQELSAILIAQLLDR